jgi:hypothetical protein
MSDKASFNGRMGKAISIAEFIDMCSSVRTADHAVGAMLTYVRGEGWYLAARTGNQLRPVERTPGAQLRFTTAEALVALLEIVAGLDDEIALFRASTKQPRH